MTPTKGMPVLRSLLLSLALGLSVAGCADEHARPAEPPTAADETASAGLSDETAPARADGDGASATEARGERPTVLPPDRPRTADDDDPNRTDEPEPTGERPTVLDPNRIPGPDDDQRETTDAQD